MRHLACVLLLTGCELVVGIEELHPARDVGPADAPALDAAAVDARPADARPPDAAEADAFAADAPVDAQLLDAAPVPDAAMCQLRGTVTGLDVGESVSLSNFGRVPVVVSTSTFALASIECGTGYEITIADKPLAKDCVIEDGSGVASSDVTNIAVNCTLALFHIGGTVGGLTVGNSLTLTLTVGATTEPVTLTADGSYTFTTAIPGGSVYSIAKSAIAGKTCYLSRGSGLISTDISDANVTCVSGIALAVAAPASSPTRPLGPVTVRLATGETVIVAAGSTQAFIRAFNTGDVFSASVVTGPDGQLCTLSPASGTIGTTPLTINLDCNAYAVRATARGLAKSGATLTVRNNGSTTATATLAAPVTAAMGYLANGSAYNVTVASNPSEHTCTVLAPTGTIMGAPAMLDVRCVFAGAGAGFIVNNGAGDCGSSYDAASSSIVLDAAFVPSRVYVTLVDLEHSSAGDLSGYLSHGGETATLFDPDSCSPMDLTELAGTYVIVAGAGVTLGDEIDNTMMTVDDGSYSPQSSFGVFLDNPVSGTWTVELRDNRNSDAGSLGSWTLHIEP